MAAPRIKLLYFKNVLDVCFRRFFEDFNGSFTRALNGDYVLSDAPQPEKTRKYFVERVKEVLNRHVRLFDPLAPEYFFIIGGCDPRDNMLLDFADRRLPERLVRVLESDPCPKYVLRENDIKIDIGFFNSLVDGLFADFFARRTAFGADWPHVFAVKHRRLDCYSVFKVLKYLYGRSSCVNVWKDEFEDRRHVLVAVNDLIDRYVRDKAAANRSREFKMIVAEVKEYCDGCIEGVLGGRA